MSNLIIIDADGCLTDNKVWYTHKGQRIKSFMSRDIRSIKELISNGFEVLILTQSSWPGLKEFVKRTGAEIAVAQDKLKYITENNLKDFICVVDDIADIDVCKLANFTYLPLDADLGLIAELRHLEIGFEILTTKGGDGIVSELVKEV